MKQIFSIKSLIAFCILLSACQSNANMPETLIKLPNAINPKYQTTDTGIFQLNYTLKAQYPAKDIIYNISKQLGTNGWQQLSKDYFNRSLTSSHIQGWTNHINAKKSPHQKIYEWKAQWNHANGDIVGYEFTYSYPTDKTPNLSELTINAYHIPAQSKEGLKAPPTN